jgi:CPA1 family monovalent cation:H+ antiporter
VLAVVSGGLLLSQNRHLFLGSASRLRGVNVWDSLCFVLNGLVFMLIGLDLPEIVAGLGDVSLRSAIGYGVLITGVLIVGRLLAAYGAVIVTLIARNFITVADSRNPGLKGPLLIGWTGMRGVVSLAAALSIPVKLDNGSDFPQRNLILFITFVVILLTLLLQGLTLPFLIRKLNLPDPDATKPEAEIDAIIRLKLAAEALKYLQTHYAAQLEIEPSFQVLLHKWETNRKIAGDAPMKEVIKDVYRKVLDHQRAWLRDKNEEMLLLDEDIVRKHLRHLDLEEERLAYV